MNKKICLLFAVASSAFLSAQSIEGTITNTSHQPASDTEVLVAIKNIKKSIVLFLIALITLSITILLH